MLRNNCVVFLLLSFTALHAVEFPSVGNLTPRQYFEKNFELLKDEIVLEVSVDLDGDSIEEKLVTSSIQYHDRSGYFWYSFIKRGGKWSLATVRTKDGDQKGGTILLDPKRTRLMTIHDLNGRGAYLALGDGGVNQIRKISADIIEERFFSKGDDPMIEALNGYLRLTGRVDDHGDISITH